VKPLSIVKPSEYRAAQTKIVTVPSGFNFKIRKMTPETAQKLLRKLAPESGEITEAEITAKIQDLPELIRIVVPACVVEPKIVQGKSSSDALSLDELDPGDQLWLMMEAISFSGLEKAARKARELFRTRLTRKARR